MQCGKKSERICKEVHLKGIKWRNSDANETYWDVYRENTCYYGVDVLCYGNVNNCDIKIIEWRNDNMKNFREVIRDIKEGEVWESKNRTIRVKYGNITIENKTGFETKTNVFDENVKYELKQQPVTFEEVLNSDKRCRVEHELIEESNSDEFVSIINLLTCGFTDESIKEIIKMASGI